MVKATIENVIFAQKAAIGDLEAARDGLLAVTGNLRAKSPGALQIRAEAHFHLAETLWSLDDRERATKNFDEALGLADQGGFRLDSAHYAAGFSGVYISRALQNDELNERALLRDEALRLIDRAELARDIGTADSERVYLLAQYQRADLLSWVDNDSKAGIELLRRTIERQIEAKSRATIDALEISFPQLWSTIIEKSGDMKAALDAVSWWEKEAERLVGPASKPAIEARRYLAETYNMMGQPEVSVTTLDELFEDVVRWHGEASEETQDFVKRYYLPYMQHFGESDRAAKAEQTIAAAEESIRGRKFLPSRHENEA